MHGRVTRYILALFIFIAGFAIDCKAQFKEEAFQQTYNEKGDSTAVADTADKLFSFKEWGRGLAHKQKIEIGTMFAGSVFAPGTAQIYNKDYWKLPVIYGGIGALAGTGGYYLSQYKKTGDPSAKSTGIVSTCSGVLNWRKCKTAIRICSYCL